MDKNICRFSEGVVTLPSGYCERTLNTLNDTRSILPTITISRDSLGNHNSVEEYIDSQLSILKSKMKEWLQEPYELVVLGDNLTSGILINYSFLRPDKVRSYQKQAIFTLNMEDLLIFSVSKSSVLTNADNQCFTDTLKSFKTNL
ncbi:DcrB-related protein [Rahnella variigena]|uniref:DUF1795 domain-containing protein n=1 Tax=Rahnella variigena TaxID=574964 RepID=A0ABX9PPE0_9GAMM|nr:DcrB-related protein [Rahnella variigena]RJT53514.1 DUF1795 domain-containing protein [Rahnella variigena]RKF66209.1 hypothetical protein CKQ54_22655 [Rahnella variigena]